MKRIHIVGVSPRTGTTLMAEAIKTCFAIDCYTSHEDRLFTRPKGNCELYLSKCPRDIMIVGPSLRVDPDLYVICMIRDPRDIISSKHKKDPERYWAGLSFWKHYTRMLDKLDGHPRFISVKYEDFVSRPDEVQHILAEGMPFLKQQACFTDYHKVAEVSDASRQALRSVRPIRPTSVGRWKKHKARIAGQLQQHKFLIADLVKFGYEEDDQWLAELEGVEPDLSPSHHPEHMSFKKKRLLTLGKFMEAGRRVLEQMVRKRIRITHPKKWLRNAK